MRVIVNDVLLPNWPMFHGKCLRLSPRTTMQLSQFAFSTSAATRDVAVCEYVPRLPTPRVNVHLAVGRDAHEAVEAAAAGRVERLCRRRRRVTFEPLRLAAARLPLAPS